MSRTLVHKRLLAAFLVGVLGIVSAIVSSSGSARAASCIDLTTSMYIGATDARKNGEVTLLQNYLIANGYLTGTTATGFYGRLTRQAVGTMQIKLGIVSSAQDASHGYFGPRTRSAIACGGTGATPGSQASAQSSPSKESGAGEKTIWFAPMDNVALYWDANYNRKKGEADFMDLFSTKARSWATIRDKIHVFLFYSQFVEGASDEQLSTIFEFLKAHHIALAVVTPMLHIGAKGCGGGVEGYLPPLRPNYPSQIVERIKSNGGDLAYLAADESFQANRGATGCQLSQQDAGKDIASVFAIYQAQFPNVRYVDEGNIPNPEDQPVWGSDYGAWADAIAQYTGKPVAAFHMDVDWNNPYWALGIPSFYDVLQQRNIPFGVIQNGAAGQTSSQAWMNSAIANIDRYRENADLPDPQQEVFQTWDGLPTTGLPATALPEDAASGHLYLITYYLSLTNPPTATLTASSSKDITVNVGDYMNYAWSSTNVVSATSTFTVDTEDTCNSGTGPFPWVASTLSGTAAASDSTIFDCQAGHTYTITYTVTGTNSQTATATLTVRVLSPPTSTSSTTRGYLDTVSCRFVTGWAQDQDIPNSPIDVHLYVDTPPQSNDFSGYVASVKANIYRSDLCSAIGSCRHGFNMRVPAKYRDGKQHILYAFGIDSDGVGEHNSQLLMGDGVSSTIRCEPK